MTKGVGLQAITRKRTKAGHQGHLLSLAQHFLTSVYVCSGARRSADTGIHWLYSSPHPSYLISTWTAFITTSIRTG